jgi:hypothetical protein
MVKPGRLIVVMAVLGCTSGGDVGIDALEIDPCALGVESVSLWIRECFQRGKRPRPLWIR